MVEFEKNMKLVYKIVTSEYKNRQDKEDICQSGFIGLWKACMYYNDCHGNTFSTFAVKCIRNEINLYLRHERKNKSICFTDIEAANENKDTKPLENYGAVTPDFTELKFYIITRNLSISDKTILRMIFEGYSQPEIARMYKVSKSAMSKRIIRIRNQIIGGNNENKKNTKQKKDNSTDVGLCF